MSKCRGLIIICLYRWNISNQKEHIDKYREDLKGVQNLFLVYFHSSVPHIKKWTKEILFETKNCTEIGFANHNLVCPVLRSVSIAWTSMSFLIYDPVHGR